VTEQAILHWITDYGYFGIFFLLIFGIIGLPIPDEWLLVISGYLAFKDVLGLFPTLATAALGSAGGLTVSYVLGRTSSEYVVRKYGRWLSIDNEKILRAQHWFQNLGRWVLIVGPFIPGVRNLIGYLAGASKLRLHVFVRFAYLGALISSTTFVSFGYFAGRHVNWSYSRFPLVAVALAAAFTLTGTPFRIALRIRNKIATAAANKASLFAEASTQVACEPKKYPAPTQVTDDKTAPA
jgi:membrane protein DedA with SNARE-associated domain